MAKDTLAIKGIPLNPAGINDSSPLDAENNFYQTRGIVSLNEQCLERLKGKELIKKFNSPILGIHGLLKNTIFIETANTLYFFNTIEDIENL